MSPPELERYLYDHIPLAKAMQVRVHGLAEDSVVLGAPLAPNINHLGTVFGGSASALAILCAWALLHTRLRRAAVPCRLVIQRNSMSYELPIDGGFTARSFLEPSQDWSAFLRLLARRGKARVSVSSVLAFGGQTAGHFSGEFVALGQAGTASPCAPEIRS